MQVKALEDGNFTEWLKTHKGDESPLGDLAEDAANDPSWPTGGRSLAEFVHYLERTDAAYSGRMSRVIKTMRNAWRCWSRHQARSN